MAGKEFNLRAVEQDLVLCGLQRQDISDVLGRGGVMIRFKLNEPICIADPQGHFRGVIGMKGQRLKDFLGKKFQGSVPGCIMDVQIGLLFKPPLGCGPKILHILKVSSIEEIAFYVFKRSFNFPFRLSPAPDRNGLTLIMRNEGRKRRIENRFSAFPSEHHGLFRIVETFLRYPAIILEDIPMPSD